MHIYTHMCATHTHTHTHTHEEGVRKDKVFPGVSAGKLPVMRCGFISWIRKIPWRRKLQPAPVFLLRKFYGERNLAGYSPQRCKESDTT